MPAPGRQAPSRWAQRWLRIRRMVIATLAELPEPFTRRDAWEAVAAKKDPTMLGLDPPSSEYVMQIIHELELDGDLVRVHRTDGKVRPYLYKWAEGDT